MVDPKPRPDTLDHPAPARDQAYARPVRLPKLLYMFPVVATFGVSLAAGITGEVPWAALTLAGLATSSVTHYVMVYRMWKSIQWGGTARTGPGKALGLMLVPVFNIYWAYQAYWGFAQDYNRLAKVVNARTSDTDRRLDPVPTGRYLALGVLYSIAQVVIPLSRSALATAWSPVTQNPNQAGSAEALAWVAAAFGLFACGNLLVVTDSVCNAVNGLADLQASDVDTASSADWQEKAAAAEANEDAQEAIRCYQKGLASDPSAADAWFNMGGVHCDLGQWEQARECYTQALKLKPRDPSFLYGRAYAEDHLGRDADAIRFYTQYLTYAAPEDRERIQYAHGRLVEFRGR